MNKSDINHTKQYFKYLKNPLQCLLFKLGFLKNCNVKFKYFDDEIKIKKTTTIDKIMVVLPSINTEKYDDFLNFISEADSDKKVISVMDFEILNSHNTIFAEAFTIDFWNIDVKDRSVIDIGGNVADTCLYFLNKGAKNIIAFEPVKELFNIGLKNIDLNPQYKSQIEFYNKAVSCKRGKLNIKMDSTSHYINEEDNYEVDVITVNDILNDYNIKPDVLKMDCEGCEFDIILNTDLSMFKDIIFEHHSKLTNIKYEVLVEKLKSENFKIQFFKVFNADFNDYGFIHAYK